MEVPRYRRKAAEMRQVFERIDRDRTEIIVQYKAGDALGYLAQQYDVDRHRMKRFLIDWDVPLRTRASATRKHHP
ncbi:hypothetical protein AF335_04985 [Streptomyces eurocidicus]|nr:hypothetical protein AF335_04985 [Streptomyces eurocidicus]